MKKAIFTFLTIILFSGCSSVGVELPYLRLHVPEKNIASCKRVLLAGPLFAAIGLNDDSWLRQVRNFWGVEIIKNWKELRRGNDKLFEMVLPDISRPNDLDKLIKEQRLSEVPVYDGKGRLNMEYVGRLKTAVGGLAEKAGADAVLTCDFMLVPVKIRDNEAQWDGQYEEDIVSMGDVTWAKEFLGDAKARALVNGEATALSFIFNLIDKDGRLLYEGRSGYKVIPPIVKGEGSDWDQKKQALMKAFSEEHRKKRDMATGRILAAIADIISKGSGK